MSHQAVASKRAQGGRFSGNTNGLAGSGYEIKNADLIAPVNVWKRRWVRPTSTSSSSSANNGGGQETTEDGRPYKVMKWTKDEEEVATFIPDQERVEATPVPGPALNLVAAGAGDDGVNPVVDVEMNGEHDHEHEHEEGEDEDEEEGEGEGDHAAGTAGAVAEGEEDNAGKKEDKGGSAAAALTVTTSAEADDDTETEPRKETVTVTTETINVVADSNENLATDNVNGTASDVLVLTSSSQDQQQKEPIALDPKDITARPSMTEAETQTQTASSIAVNDADVTARPTAIPTTTALPSDKELHEPTKHVQDREREEDVHVQLVSTIAAVPAVAEQKEQDIQEGTPVDESLVRPAATSSIDEVTGAESGAHAESSDTRTAVIPAADATETTEQV